MIRDRHLQGNRNLKTKRTNSQSDKRYSLGSGVSMERGLRGSSSSSHKLVPKALEDAKVSPAWPRLCSLARGLFLLSISLTQPGAGELV